MNRKMYIMLLFLGIGITIYAIYGLANKNNPPLRESVAESIEPTRQENDNPATDTKQQATRPIAAQPLSSPEEKGFAFEKFVDDRFPTRWFNRLEWRSDIKGNNGRLSESSRYPDLEYEIRKGRHRFAVECKWRAHFQTNDGEEYIEWASSPRQLNNYRQYADKKQIDGIVIIGVGGEPDNPNDLYSIPFSDLSATKISRQDLYKYRLNVIPDAFFYDTTRHNLRLEYNMSSLAN